MKAKTTTRAGAATPPAKSGTAVTRRPGTAVSTLNYGSVGPQAGLEGADRDSFAIAFLRILQKLSPELDKNDEKYIKGANEGDVINTANQAVYDGGEGILVLPVSFKRSFTSWVIREKGGGYKGEHAPSDPIVMTTQRDVKGRNMLADGVTQLVDTRLHGVILLNGDIPQPGLISLTSSQIKKSKRWMTYMQEQMVKDNMPTFAHIYKLTTVPEKNDQGNWMGWKVDPEGDVTEQEHIDAAVSLYQALQTGALKMRADAGEPQHAED